ncbi:MAG: hypothetical protein ACQES8_05230 [Thermodesulfobacteriota bacterium]
MRAHLNADKLFPQIHRDFAKVENHCAGNSQIPLDDVLMSGFAMFSLKNPSLLAFDKRRLESPSSIHTVYGVGQTPCDSQMRDILDPISPKALRRPFRSVFAQLQRGKAMEKITWLNGYYLLALDGTGIFSSEQLSSEYCLRKKTKRQYRVYQQILGAASATVKIFDLRENRTIKNTLSGVLTEA